MKINCRTLPELAVPAAKSLEKKMKWITPQELSKIAKKSPDSEKYVPERTIRHMALQKRIATKKDGKTWKIDPASAIRAGLYIAPENLEPLRLKQEPSHSMQNTPTSAPAEPSINQNSVIEDKKEKKYKRLGELGVYNELKDLYRKNLAAQEGPIKEAIKQTLYHLALGFYEYSKVNKAEYFKRARKCLAGAIVEDDLASEDLSAWREQLENSIMPGIVGLIRKQEGEKRGRGQLKTKGKD